MKTALKIGVVLVLLYFGWRFLSPGAETHPLSLLGVDLGQMFSAAPGVGSADAIDFDSGGGSHPEPGENRCVRVHVPGTGPGDIGVSGATGTSYPNVYQWICPIPA